MMVHENKGLWKKTIGLLGDLQIIRTGIVGTVMWLISSGLAAGICSYFQDVGWFGSTLAVLGVVTCVALIRELCLHGSPRQVIDITHSDVDKVRSESGGTVCCVTVHNRSSRTIEAKLKIERLEAIPYDPNRQKKANRFVETYLTPQDAEYIGRTYEQIATFSIGKRGRKRIQVVHFRRNNKWFLLIAKGHTKEIEQPRRVEWHRDDAEIIRGRYRITLVVESTKGRIGKAAFEFDCTDPGIAIFESPR